jgi:F-type H+-transporting ATPase subunit a
MMKVKISVLTLLFSLFFVGATTAHDHAHESHDDHHDHAVESIDVRAEVKETIAHHLKDTHYFELFHGVSFPLPVILWDEEFHIFMSSAFHHGETVAESKGKYYAMDHGKIYSTNAAGTINYDDDHHALNAKPLDLSITKNVFVIMLMSLLLFVVFSRLSKSYRNGPIPVGFGRLLEPLVLFVRDDIAIPNIGEKHYKKYMSYLLTVFFFIWFINLAGMTPLGINITGNIAVTFALALITYFITQFTANKNYWGHIFWMPGVPVPMKLVLMPIELLGTIIKPFSLMIRLYANITAGHVVLMALIGLVYMASNFLASGAFFGLTLFLGLIELLVAFLQAYIFTMLTALYFGSAVEEHHDEH